MSLEASAHSSNPLYSITLVAFLYIIFTYFIQEIWQLKLPYRTKVLGLNGKEWVNHHQVIFGDNSHFGSYFGPHANYSMIPFLGPNWHILTLSLALHLEIENLIQPQVCRFLDVWLGPNQVTFSSFHFHTFKTQIKMTVRIIGNGKKILKL